MRAGDPNGVVGVLFLLLPLATACDREVDLSATGALLERWTAEAEPPSFLGERPGLHRSWESIRGFYASRRGRPLWLEEDGPSAQARILVGALCDAGEQGLEPARYRLPALRDRRRALAGVGASAEDSAAAAATLELTLTASLVSHATDLSVGMLAPGDRGANVHLAGRTPEPRALLESLAAGAGVADLLASLAPRDDGYAALVRELGRLRLTEAAGGWPEVPPGSYRPGDDGPAAGRLRRRLAAGGDLDRESAGGRGFDVSVSRALRRFQARHGIHPTGAVDDAALEALNVPVGTRIRTVRRNLERWRWLPRELGARHILVNLPAFSLTVFADGGRARSMPVVVGARYRGRATPLLSDTLTAIEFSPYWDVPRQIALDEILPEARSEPGFLVRNGFELVPRSDGAAADGEVLPALHLPSNGGEEGAHGGPGDALREIEEAIVSGRASLRQRPGPTNALGRVKFLFPNPLAIYFHDTPERELFGRTTRAFSHGCIRVARPGDLAEFCLGPAGWNRERVERAMASGEARRVRMPHPLPVHIAYFTAFVDGRGRLNFRDDVYGWDTELERTLLERELRPREREAASRACRDLLEG